MNESKNREECDIESWNRFVTRGLAVFPEVMGKSHCFEYDDHKIEIKLPDITKVEEQSDNTAMATIGSRLAETNEPIYYEIHQVDVRVSASNVLLIDPETFNRNPVAYDLYTVQECNIFEKACAYHEDIAKQSFEYWLSVLRWMIDDYRIGRVEIIGNDTGWSTYLKDSMERRTVWVQRMMYAIEGCGKVKPVEWEAIQGCLERKDIPPVYISLKHNAEESLNHGDYVRSIIDLAMSCEIFLRFMVLKRLPEELHDNLVESIEELNISQYVNKHFKALITGEDLSEYKKLSKDLKSLFDKRNKILHMGKNDGATKDNCIRFLEVTKKLFDYRERLASSPTA